MEYKMLSQCKQQSKKYLSSLSLVIALSTIGLTANTAYSEVLQMPVAPQSFSVTLPGRGMSMTEVIEKFGEAQSKDPEVGEPPITRWNYPGYVVIFEYQYVIHALTTNKPMGLMQPQLNTEPATDSQVDTPMNEGTDAMPPQVPTTPNNLNASE